MAHADVIVNEISCEQKFHLTTFFSFFFFSINLKFYLLLMVSKKMKCVFEKQIILFLVSTHSVKRICNLISAEKATFQRKKCCAML